ncbi:MAG: glutamate-5-semialdehyde dehydrogenase, partial [Anaerohalosphaera sp.]|nr:glutamate-5-semialdehyde dehydrogenase [Anaerohalosphaera sp.]
MSTLHLASAAKSASIRLAAAETAVKNNALAAIMRSLRGNAEAIAAENGKDLAKAEKDCLAGPLLKRLKFDQGKIDEVCSGIESLIGLDDPVGATLAATELDEKLELYKVACPIGVIGVIFESRPDALVQISALCLKSGNACLLKGGSEAINTNRILARLIAEATAEAGIVSGWIGLIETRDEVAEMLSMDRQIDLLIPRGSNEFVRYIMENSNIPVLGHADGICHVYVDADCDVDMAVDITVDSKTQYCAVCNALETLLVHADIAGEFLPKVAAALRAKGVELRGCEKTAEYIEVIHATEEDWKTEYLDEILSIKVVDSLDEAVEHINTYGSGHTETIVTGDKDSAKYFMDMVDSADVFVNCSTRFSDGFRFGFGAEVGISTNKIHARGPVGLDGLLIYKYHMVGN